MSRSTGKAQMKRIMAGISILLTVLAGVAIYSVYNGYLLLNHPSSKRYPVRGVDVSHYQGTIDWTVLSEEKLDFAYIKATEGSGYLDERFVYNWEQAGRTGLKTGAYHFFSFDSSGKTQAEHFIDTVKMRDGMLPPVVDVEYYGDKKSNPPKPEALRRELQVMLDEIREHYRMMPVIYSTEEVWETYLSGYFDDYPLWIRNVVSKPDKEARWTFWQYTNRARLDGYQGEETFIDMNVFSGSRGEWEAWTESGGYPTGEGE